MSKFDVFCIGLSVGILLGAFLLLQIVVIPLVNIITDLVDMNVDRDSIGDIKREVACRLDK